MAPKLDEIVAGVEAKAQALLDADEDGKLSVEDARKLAISLEGAASSYAEETLLALLDADGDGRVSWDEAEAGARRALHRAEECATRAVDRLRPYKDSLLAGAGFLSCFYGSNFKYTLLFAQTFAATGWPALKPALSELGASYRRGKRAFVKAAPELKRARETLAEIRRDAAGVAAGNPEAQKKLLGDAADAAALLKSGESIFAAVDPKKLGKVLQSAYVGISSSFAAVLSDHAAKLGVGVGLGTAVADAINVVVAPIISKLLRTLKARALANGDVREVLDDLERKADIDDDALLAWVESAISLASTAAGVYVAHRLDDVMYLYSACVAGATLCADKCLLLAGTTRGPLDRLVRSKQVRQVAICSLAASGFWYQRVLGRGQLPFFVALPLAPLKISESILASMAVSFRAASVAPA